MKKLILFLTGIIVLGIGNAQKSIPPLGEEEYRTNVVFKSSYNNQAKPLEADVVLAYNHETNYVTLRLYPKFEDDYNYVWLPIRNTFYSGLNNLVKAYGAGYSTTFTFRHDIKVGSGVAFKTENISYVEYPMCEIFSNDSVIQYSFKVDKEQKPVSITFAAVVPVERYNSCLLNRDKFKFHYIADPVTLEFNVKGDPCRIPENELLKKNVAKLKKYADGLYDEMTNTVVSKDVKRCDQMKGEFKDSIQPFYEYYFLSHNEMERRCPSVDKDLGEIQERIEEANRLRCPVPVYPCNTKEVVKRIKEGTDELMTINASLRVKMDVDENLKEGMLVIKKVKNMVNQLKPDCARNVEIKKAYDFFQSKEKDYNGFKDKYTN